MPKVSIYRLEKRGSTRKSFSQFLSSPDKGRKIAMGDANVALFMIEGKPRVPEWVGYLAGLAVTDLDAMATASAGAVLFLSPGGADNPTYACTWGTGHLHLNKRLITPDLGLRVAFNLIAEGSVQALWDVPRVRSTQTKSLAGNGLLSATQASRELGIMSFPVDRRNDVIRGITAIPIDADKWGRLVTGATAIQVQRPATLSAMRTLCNDIEAKYHSLDYRQRYAWIDDLRPVVDAKTRRDVVDHIVSLVRKGDEAIALSPATVIEWDTVQSFKFSFDDTIFSSLPDCAHYRDLLTTRKQLNTLDTDTVEADHELLGIDESGEVSQAWSVLECLSATVTISGTTYVLEGGSVYQVRREFVTELDDLIDSIKLDSIGLPDWISGDEDAYNKDVALKMNALCLDRAFVRRVSETPIELCDVAWTSGTLLHVKKGRGSGSASYVMAQAAVSAELLRSDETFRSAVRTMLEEAEKKGKLNGTPAAALAWSWASPFDCANCTVSIGMIAKWPAGKKLSEQLSFFSKLVTRTTTEALRRSNFTMTIERISE